MPIKSMAAALAICATLPGAALAASSSYSGTLINAADVADIGFTLATTATDVALWTDSFDDGANFDPILTLFKAEGSDWLLVEQNDDFGDGSGVGAGISIGAKPGQSAFGDSIIAFSSLAAGQYRLFVSVYDNFHSANLNESLSLGWSVTAPFPINAGSSWRATVEYTPSAPVPEPSTWLMVALGLAALGWRRRQA